MLLSGTDRNKWWPEGTGQHEVTFAYSPFTLELKQFEGRGKEADAWKASFTASEWVTGTIDWLAKRRGGIRWWVDDFKTGAWPVSAEESRQVRSYAVVPWLLDGQTWDFEIDVSITQWPKYPLDGEPYRAWHVLTTFDLEEHLADLRWALTHPEEVNPVWYGPPQKDPITGRYQFGEKLPVCAGCECREPTPGVSEWLTNFWYRSFPHCWPGTTRLLNEGLQN